MSRTLPLMVSAIALAGGFAHGQPVAATPPNRFADLIYTEPFFPAASYAPDVPRQESLIGFPTGQRAATSRQVERCVRAWVEKSDRADLVEYARSHEEKRLYYVVVTSPENHQRIDAIHAGMDRLADPRGLSDSDADDLIGRLPAIAMARLSPPHAVARL